MGDKLKAARLKAGLTQSQLAQKLGLAQQAIQRYESGVVEPRATTLKRLAEALDCTMEDLV